MKKGIILLVVLISFGLLGCGGNQSGSKKFTIAVVPKGTTHVFWKSIYAGARKAADDYKAQGETPTIRRIASVGGIDTKKLFQLFPKKPAKKVSYIAGVPKPHGCV